MKIQSTTKYDLFHVPPSKRPLYPKHVNKLAASMTKYGYLEIFPVVVRYAATKLVVISGKHRVAAAIRTGVPVHYVVNNELTDSQMTQLEDCQRVWCLADYVVAYAHLGDQPPPNNRAGRSSRIAKKGVVNSKN